jgi:hypothetical protein
LKTVTDFKQWNKIRTQFKKINKESFKLNETQKDFIKGIENNVRRYEFKKEFKAILMTEV